MAIPISAADILAVKKAAKELHLFSPALDHGQCLDLASKSYGARDYHELKLWRKKTVAQPVHVEGRHARCIYCGLKFLDDIGSEHKLHEQRHNTYELAVHARGYKPRLKDEREDLKDEGWRELNNNSANVRLAAALKIVRGWYDRSLEAAIFDGHWKKHPEFDEYVSCMLSSGCNFPSKVQEVLEGHFLPSGTSRSYSGCIWQP